MTELTVKNYRPYTIKISDEALTDLKSRLAHARWPERETVLDWSQGMPINVLRDIVEYWQNEYDWRYCERQINELGSHLIEIDGLDIHFLHIASKHKTAKPLIITHGWPSSIIEFFDIIPMLTDPLAHGGSEEDAFHVVIPSLPGFGFSGKPDKTGWNVEKIADAWNALMQSLRYSKYLAQGGDWGSAVTTSILNRHPESCVAAHVNLVMAMPDQTIMTTPTPEEIPSLQKAAKFQEDGTGYSKIQSTRPQTLGYALNDSPIGQAAWILEKFYEWTDNDGSLSSVGSIDHLLNNVTLYWLSACATSSARLYWEGYEGDRFNVVEGPIGCSIFPQEINTPSQRWAETRYKNIIYWNMVEKGGHFAPLEQPQVLTQEIRNCFRDIEVKEQSF